MATSKERERSGKESEPPAAVPKSQADDATALLFRSGGAYIPPAKLRKLQAQITDKSSAAYQRLAWEALKKSLNGAVNKANVSNLPNVIRELLHENVIRGRGMLVRSIIKAQSVSPTFAHVYAAMVSVVNTKFPQIGDLLLRRLIMTFKRSFRRNQKDACVSSLRFIAHLINQNVIHELLALEICLLLLLQPTNDSVECVVGFLKECGAKLQEVSPRAVHSVFERLRDVLHESALDVRVQYAVEVLFQVRKDGFKEHQPVQAELNLVDEDEQNTHTLRLDDNYPTEDQLDVFKVDPNFQENEDKYATIRDEILGDAEDSDADSDAESGQSHADSGAENGGEEKAQVIVDRTETDLVELRKTIYLTIQSSLDFQECVHKLVKLKLEENQLGEMCAMILDCCAQLRTYEKFYGLVAQRFCMINKRYVDHYERLFTEQYSTSHRLETIKLRNVARFFAHLLHSDAITWNVLKCIRLTEEETTSSSRIFLKILLQELAEFLSLAKLHDRLNDPTLAEAVAGIFPRDSPKNTRFAVNFLTCVGLGGLTDELREFLRTGFAKDTNDEPQLDEGAQEAANDGKPPGTGLVEQLNAMIAEEQARRGLQNKSDGDKDTSKKSKSRKKRDRKRSRSSSASQSESAQSVSASQSEQSDYETARKGSKKHKSKRSAKHKARKRSPSLNRSRSRSLEKGDTRRGKRAYSHDSEPDNSPAKKRKEDKKLRKSKRSASSDSDSDSDKRKQSDERGKKKRREESRKAARRSASPPAAPVATSKREHRKAKDAGKRRKASASRSHSRSRSPTPEKSRKDKSRTERKRRSSQSRSPTPKRVERKHDKSAKARDRERRRSPSRSQSWSRSRSRTRS